jgi:hypothetical protein
LLAGLDVEYNSVVSAVAARVEPITPSELLSQMIAMNFALRSYKGVMAIKLLLQTPPCVAVVDKEAAVVAAMVVVTLLEVMVVVVAPTTTTDLSVSCVAKLAPQVLETF